MVGIVEPDSDNAGWRDGSQTAAKRNGFIGDAERSENVSGNLVSGAIRLQRSVRRTVGGEVANDLHPPSKEGAGKSANQLCR